MRIRRIAAIAAVLAILLALLVYGFRPPAQRVDVAVASRGTLQVTIEEEGKTRVNDRYVISAPVAGYVRRIELEVGDAIKRGQRIATLDPLPAPAPDARSRAAAEARIAAAGAALAAAREQAAAAAEEARLAQTEHQRISDLCKVQCASPQEQDQARTRARSSEARDKSARFAADVARHELEAARTALAYAGRQSGGAPIAIVSPIDGSVLKRLRESEGVAGAAEPLIEVGDVQRLEVVVDVLSADAVRIAPGTRVMFERWGGEQPLEGRVRATEPVGFTKVSALGVEEQRVLVICDIVSAPPLWQKRLGDGYRVEASFILWEGADVLTIPASSLFRVGDRWAAFVAESGVARRRTLELGQRNGLSAQVLSGLKEGERVITHPSEAIEDGVKVELR